MSGAHPKTNTIINIFTFVINFYGYIYKILNKIEQH